MFRRAGDHRRTLTLLLAVLLTTQVNAYQQRKAALQTYKVAKIYWNEINQLVLALGCAIWVYPEEQSAKIQ